MAILFNRKNLFFTPDSKRVLAGYFNLSVERKEKVIQRVINLPKEERKNLLNQLLRTYSERHRSVIYIWRKNFKRALEYLNNKELEEYEYNQEQKMLLGAYFTLEYSVESAAFFNPSIVESPDQSQLREGEKRIILSFRAVGEGHVSSIVFRSGVIDQNLDIHLDIVGNHLERPKKFKNYQYNKVNFMQKLQQLSMVNNTISNIVKEKFTNTFTYEELKRFIDEIRIENKLDITDGLILNQIQWLASSHYEMTYTLDSLISERVIFPIADTEKNGIEDARFLKFVNERGDFTYYATYTAYNGITIMPKLLSTKDFVSYKVQPINGKIANKGAALFPRKINGKYAMLCRIDGENNYIAFSDNIINWQQDIQLIREPEHPWEFIQIGNCGAPIETAKGWLVLTHGVGPMREYSICATLLDLDDPTKIIGRLDEPLIYPNKDEREGYVPNVVYSCGQIIHNGHLVIPYGMSDYASTYGTINLDELIQKMLN